MRWFRYWMGARRAKRHVLKLALGSVHQQRSAHQCRGDRCAGARAVRVNATTWDDAFLLGIALTVENCVDVDRDSMCWALSARGDGSEVVLVTR